MASINFDASVSLALPAEFGIKVIPKFRHPQGVARVKLLVTYKGAWSSVSVSLDQDSQPRAVIK
jgi:hypothetical protein